MDEHDRCREVLRRLCAEVGQAESSSFCREVARHLERCGACRAQAESLRGTLSLYRCLGSKEVPPEVSRKLRARLGLA